MSKVCCFAGHRKIPASLDKSIEGAVEAAFECGITDFYVGEQGAFDRLAAVVVRKLKDHDSQVRLFLILSYLPTQNKQRYNEQYDATIYPEGLENCLPRYAIEKRNRWMINHADMLIAYVNHDWGGAYKTYKYALSHLGSSAVLNLGSL